VKLSFVVNAGNVGSDLGHINGMLIHFEQP